MSDDRIMEYLRSRGRAVPPTDLAFLVMEAVDAAAPRASRFSPFLPAMAAAVVVAAVVIVALALGQGPHVGPPVPSASLEASPPAHSATREELEAAVIEATARLQAADAVQGRQAYEIDGHLASATWFDWRPTGEQVVITRTDIDVSAPWWADPDGEPLSVGERIREEIHVIGGDGWYRALDGAWIVDGREEAPPVLTFGAGLPSGEITPLAGVDPATVSRVTRRTIVGGETWTVEIRDGEATGTVEWTIADGVLSRYTVVGVNVAAEPEFGLGEVSTSMVVDFAVVPDPAPIRVPDPDAAPNADAFGLPVDFPLGPAAAASIDYRAYVEDVLDVLETTHWDAASVDWVTARAAALDGLAGGPTADQAHQRILDAIRTFDTFGTHFVRPADVPPGSHDPEETFLPEAERMGSVGYLWLPSYAGTDDDAMGRYVTAARAEMDRVTLGAAIDGASPVTRPAPSTCGWVVDLRTTTGRSATPLVASVAGLLDAGRLLTYRSALGEWWLERGSDGSVALVDDRQSEMLPSPTIASVLAGATVQGRIDAAALAAVPRATLATGIPIAILTSPITAGPGEQVALALRQLPTVRTFGGVTAGMPQEVLILRMVDGAELRVPTALPVVAGGDPVAGNLVPDEVVAETEAGAADPVLERAVAWLENQDACS